MTANLYLPTTGDPPYPAILYPLGHERGGKTNPTWQQMLGSLATKGFVALTWDPIGQGEGLQIYRDFFLQTFERRPGPVGHAAVHLLAVLGLPAVFVRGRSDLPRTVE